MNVTEKGVLIVSNHVNQTVMNLMKMSKHSVMQLEMENGQYVKRVDMVYNNYGVQNMLENE